MITQKQQQFILKHLSVDSKDEVVDTWLDDDGPNESAIANYVLGALEDLESKGQPIATCKHPDHPKGYMQCEVYQFGNVSIVFQPGMPDAVFFAKRDFGQLKQLIQ